MDGLPLTIELHSLGGRLVNLTGTADSGMCADLQFDQLTIGNVDIENLYSILKGLASMAGADQEAEGWIEDTDCVIQARSQRGSTMVHINIKNGQASILRACANVADIVEDLSALERNIALAMSR